MDAHKTKNFLYVKENNQVKRTPTEWKESLVVIYSKEDCYLEYMKNILKRIRKTNNPATPKNELWI